MFLRKIYGTAFAVIIMLALFLVFSNIARAGGPGPQKPCKPDTVWMPCPEFDPMVVIDTVYQHVPVWVKDTILVYQPIVEEQFEDWNYGVSFSLLSLYVETDRSNTGKYQKHDMYVSGAMKWHLWYLHGGAYLLLEDSEYEDVSGIRGLLAGITLPYKRLEFDASYIYGQRFKTGVKEYVLHGLNTSLTYRITPLLSIGPTVTWFKYVSSSEAYPFVCLKMNL